MSTTQTRLLSPLLTQALHAAEQARRWYLTAAELLHQADLYVIAHAFRFTAAQETEHIAILRLLTGISVEDSAPDVPPPPSDPALLLEDAIARESTCAQELFPSAAMQAQAEGQPRIASALHSLSENERLHALRFRQYRCALADGTLLRSTEPISWFCLACGCLHHGSEAPGNCESCSASRGHFIRSTLYPFAVR